MIIDDIRHESRIFSALSTMQLYTREQFEEGMVKYIDKTIADGKFIGEIDFGWDFDDQYYVTFFAADDLCIQQCVMFFLRVPLVDDCAVDYDRAMRVI